MIRHAFFRPAAQRQSKAVALLPIPMVKAPLWTLLMSEVADVQTDQTPRRGTQQGTVDVAPVATTADHKTKITQRALAVSQILVHIAPAWIGLMLDTIAWTWQKSGSGWVAGPGPAVLVIHA